MSKECDCCACESSLIGGNSVDVQVSGRDCEIKADIVVPEVKSVRLWGQVETCSGRPIANALVKLIKVIHKSGDCEYRGVAHTVSDCNGFYQFDLCSDEIGCSYKILVSRAIVGGERIVSQHGDCCPCEDSCGCCPPKNCGCR